MEIRYREVSLTADRVIYWQKKEKVVAEGKVVFRRRDFEFLTDKLTYLLREGEGWGEGGIRGSYRNWYFRGEGFSFTPEKITIQEAKFTTCSLKKPHYFISTGELVIFLKDRVVARNSLFFLGKIPLFYFPYYETSLKDLPYGWVHRVGTSDRKGFTLLSHYNWWKNPRLRGRYYLDWMERKGWGGGMDVEWKEQFMKNYLYVYGFKERERYYRRYEERDEARTGEDRLKRWKIYLRGKGRRGDVDFSYRLEKLSDPLFNRDFYMEEREKGWSEYPLRREPETGFFLEKNSLRDTLGIKGRWRVNYFEEVLEEKPTLYYSLPYRSLSSGFFSFRSSLSYLSQEPRGEEGTRFLNRYTFTQPVIRRPWSITPRVYTSLDFYGEREKFFARPYTGYEITFSRTDPREDKKGLSNLFSYITLFGNTPSFTSQKDISFFEERDKIRGSRGVRVGWESIREGEERSFLWYTSIEAREEGRREEKSIFEEWDWEIHPRVSLGGGHLFDLGEEKRKYDSIYVNIKGEKVRTSLGYNFYEGRENLTLSWKWKPSGLWNVKWYERYNIEKSYSEESKIEWERRLHCWKMQVILKGEREEGRKKEWGIYIAFRIIGL